MPRASPPDHDTQFVSRRDRPEHQQRRAGTGRQIASREFGMLGRHTGVRLQQTTKDLQGFDDLDQAWKSDDDDNQEVVGAMPSRSSLFPESPASVSTVLNDPEPDPEIAVKRLVFNSNNNELDSLSSSSDDASTAAPNQNSIPANTVPLANAASKTKKPVEEAVFKVKKAARKEIAQSPIESVWKASKVAMNDDAKKNNTTREPNFENDENDNPSEVRSFSDDDEDLLPPSPIVEKPTKKAPTKQSKAKALVKKKRRQTLMIIDEAQESGIIDEETMVVENDQLVRRSQRSRCRPVAFFECEQPNYIRGPGGLFTLDRDKAVIKHVPTPPKPPHRHRPKRRRPKTWDESDNEEQLPPLSGEIKVVGPNGKERRRIVAMRASDHSMIKIATKPPVGDKLQSKDIAPMICNFDGLDGVVAGVVRIPGLGKKYPEVATRTELFYVGACERNALLVTVNNHELKLSKGDTFVVPAKNTYSIQNVSRRKQAELFFTMPND